MFHTENLLKRNTDKGKFFFNIVITMSICFLIFAAIRVKSFH